MHVYTVEDPDIRLQGPHRVMDPNIRLRVGSNLYVSHYFTFIFFVGVGRESIANWMGPWPNYPPPGFASVYIVIHARYI